MLITSEGILDYGCENHIPFLCHMDQMFPDALETSSGCREEKVVPAAEPGFLKRLHGLC